MAEARVAQCCIAGGGPAGMMLGLLLARAGVRTVVLEAAADTGLPGGGRRPAGEYGGGRLTLCAAARSDARACTQLD
jgi:2-polyprenyl-6-methoxyphenol hydroxylase-like FAD-dependent oxidoreductase